MIGDKWTLLVMHTLANGPRRNGELMQEIEGISQKMLHDRPAQSRVFDD